MDKTTFMIAASLALVIASASPAMAAEPVKPSADSILRQMSDTLASAKQFSFRGTREIDAALAGGLNLQAKSEIEVIVRRPDRMAASSTNKDGLRRMVLDGSEFTLFDGRENMYATVPMRSTLDAVPAQLAAVYGFIPPLADFVMSDPYADLRRRSQKISYLGSGTAGTPAVECHRIALSGKLADAELWIGVLDHLPRKMTAKVKGGTGAGTALTIEFTQWDLLAPATDRTFVFAPPKDALKIPMMTSAEFAARAAKK